MILTSQDIYAFQRRATDISVDVATDADPGDLTDITFRAVNETIEVLDLVAIEGGSGLLIEFTLTASDLDVWPGTYRWEMVATVSTAVHTMAFGWLIVDREVTVESSS